MPVTQWYTPRLSLVVKSASGGMIPAVRTLVRELNPNLPVTEAMPLDQVTAVEVIPQRIAAAVAASLGVVVLLLAAIGIYGLMAYSVEQRKQEIGIRLALGAEAEQVKKMVVFQGMRLALVGIVLGLAAAWGLARGMESLLYQVKPRDPMVFVAVPVMLCAVALLAVWLPARRASRVDPAIALRYE